MLSMAKEAVWVARVAAWRASGLSAAEFCKGKEYSLKGLQWWSSHLRRKSAAVREEARPAPRLARVVGAASATPSQSRPSLVVELDGARIEVPAGADRALLSMVLDALRARRAESVR